MRLSSRTALAAAAVACATTLAACGSATTGSDDEDILRVVASTNVWGSVAQAVAGDRIEVESLVTEPSADPHSYEASPLDAASDQRRVARRLQRWWIRPVRRGHPRVRYRRPRDRRGVRALRIRRRIRSARRPRPRGQPRHPRHPRHLRYRRDRGQHGSLARRARPRRRQRARLVRPRDGRCGRTRRRRSPCANSIRRVPPPTRPTPQAFHDNLHAVADRVASIAEAHRRRPDRADRIHRDTTW